MECCCWSGDIHHREWYLRNHVRPVQLSEWPKNSTCWCRGDYSNSRRNYSY